VQDVRFADYIVSPVAFYTYIELDIGQSVNIYLDWLSWMALTIGGRAG